MTREEAATLPRNRRLLLIWQDPRTRRFVRVGEFDTLVDGRLAFAYDEDGARTSGFAPLVEFPDVERAYVSDGLPAFLANRVMSSRRATFGQYRSWLGIADDVPDLPVEILVRSGGQRETDTFHVVEAPRADAQKFVARFFVSGVRHVLGASAPERLSHVRVGDEFTLRPEPDNPKNPQAMLIDTVTSEPVGYVPDWLASQMHRFQEQFEVRCTAEQVNLDAPSHLMLLARVDGVRRP